MHGTASACSAIAAWKERLSLAKLDEYELLSKERKRELDDLAKKLPLPFRLKVLDPRAVFVFPDEFGFKEALIGTEERRLEMADRYGGKLLRGKLGDGTPVGQTEKPPTGWGTVKKYVHYNRKYVTIYIDAQAGSATAVAAHLPKAAVYRTRNLPGATKPLVSHAKFIIIDRTLTLLTSANFSYSAENSNVELGLLVQDRDLATSIESLMRDQHGVLYERVI